MTSYKIGRKSVYVSITHFYALFLDGKLKMNYDKKFNVLSINL